MTIGLVLSAKMATLHEMQTVYGLEDVYDLLEIASVDAHNSNLARKSNGDGHRFTHRKIGPR